MAQVKPGMPEEPVSVKYFAAVLMAEELSKGLLAEGAGVRSAGGKALALRSPDKENSLRLLEALEEAFGEIDFISKPYTFDMTDYYNEEMGERLVRRIISFAKLLGPGDIVSFKLASRRIEDEFAIHDARGLHRLFNIDPGYIDFFKVVLASFKTGPHKVYMDKGVYVDPVLLYHEGTFEPFEWSFPDFKSCIYNDDLLKIRRLYKAALRKITGVKDERKSL